MFLALAMAAVFLLLFLGDEVDEIVMKDAHVDVTLGGSLEQGSQFGDLRLHQSEGNHRLSCLAIRCRSHSVSAFRSHRAFALFARAASLQVTSVRLRAGDQPLQGQYANDSHHAATSGGPPEQSGAVCLPADKGTESADEATSEQQ